MLSSSRFVCSRWSKLIPSLQNASQAGVLWPMQKGQPKRWLFWEPSMKGHVDKEHGRIEFEQTSFTDAVRMGWHVTKEELLNWRDEVIERTKLDPKQYDGGDMDIMYKFNKPEVLQKWSTACDSDWNEGYSSCSFKMSKNGHGLFSGYLDSERMPPDGRVNRVGWAHLGSPDARLSFFREAYYDWTGFTHLVLRVRGDGRHYGIILRTTGWFDVTWFDVYSYGLYTHGGPYWQYVKIPFSKFFFTTKARLQDIQMKVPLERIRGYGITLMDRYTGPYSLEIDFIGLEYDPSHTEEFAYEAYYIPEAKWPAPTRT